MREPDHDETARLQARTLFVVGPDETLERVNDVGRPAAPRCFVSVTSGAVHYWTTPDPPAALTNALHAWRTRVHPPLDLDAFTALPDEVVTAATPSSAIGPSLFSGPAYRFTPESAPAGELPGNVRVAQCPPNSAAVLRSAFPELTPILTQREPVVAAFDGERPAAVCFSSRTAPEACEAGVETLPEYRGRGLATAVTAYWAELVRAGGRIPLYSTSWSNTSSQAVARRLGLVRYAATLSLYAPTERV
ncbi:GNAT family N-acetyltransferase [Haloactinopolyspora alba]|uniref:GNAT family N-acetyltransferase n=1 Tax=Haloactinopolyspora alba TaxID=648780 RepID=UPI0013EC71B6|nr:GNAT family N-acetyltransferase [Haloactinopolyspora alba]